MTYKEFENKWDTTFPNTRVVFCMYDYDEDADHVTLEADFTDKEPIVKGAFKLGIPSNKYGYGRFCKGRKLTWKKLIGLLDKHMDERHVFLELMDIEDNGEVHVFLGS